MKDLKRFLKRYKDLKSAQEDQIYLTKNMVKLSKIIFEDDLSLILFHLNYLVNYTEFNIKIDSKILDEIKSMCDKYDDLF